MNGQINNENYEAFYLDYLEGNLDENTTLVLFAFLAENPDLQVDGLGPEFSSVNYFLEAGFKNILKQDQHLNPISASNIDYFLTAEKENQLSSTKIVELDAFISKYPSFKLDRKIYSLSTIRADEEVVFADKNALKQKETIALWPFLFACAAACAILVIWVLPTSTLVGEIRSAANVPFIKVKNSKDFFARDAKIEITENTSPSLAANNSLNKTNPAIKNSYSIYAISSNLELKATPKFDVGVPAKVDFSLLLKEKKPDAIAYRQAEIAETPATTMAMNNPVQPLTDKISDIIKTQVDYKTGEDVLNQRKGFYLKIGQLEISQNKKVKPN